MDRALNPYSPGAGRTPPALAGRNEELDDVRIALKRQRLGRGARSIVLTGLRGVGRTVLLGEFRRLADADGWATRAIEATERMALPRVMADAARAMLLRLSRGRRVADWSKRALGVLKSFQMRWELPDGGQLLMDLDPEPGRADSGLLDEDLADLLYELGAAARRADTGVLLTLDEVQYLKRDDLGALITAFHRLQQSNLPLLMVAAGLPSVPALAGEARSYAERLFKFRTINSLTPGDARAALSEPAEEQGVAWSPAALDRVVRETRGYPYFLQEFGKQTWDVAPGPKRIRGPDVEAAVRLAVEELDQGFFRVRFDRTTDAEREYLAAMASLGSRPYVSGQVAAAMGRDTPGVGRLRAGLIQKGLCYSPRYGEIDFTVPLFDDFVRRQEPGRLAG